MTSKVQKRIPLDSSLILEANSPANQYLVQLLDDKKELSFQKPTEARMRLLFQVLEDLVPQLDGVYSLQLTKDPDLESETAETVTRLPYFSLLRRQQDEQNQKADNLHAELNQNKEILFEKEKDLGKMLQKLEDLGKETESLKHEIVSFEEELKKKNDELLSVQHELTNLTETHTEQASRHEITVSELKSTLQGAQDHISNLNQFKELYDGLQEAFQFPVAKKNKNNLATISPKAPTNRKAVMATKKAHLHSYLKTTRNQEHQLLKVQNSVIADFEACIENHKKWLLSEKFRHSTRREEHEILMKEEEFAEKQNIFQQSMADISTELALLKQHRKSLQEQLNVLEKTLHQGDTGIQGIQSVKGDKVGDKGLLGPLGVQGKRGPGGEPGSSGAIGAKGVRGDEGPVGFQGPPGPPGPTFPAEHVIEVCQRVVLEQMSVYANVVRRKCASACPLYGDVPMGPPGPQGLNGEPGPPGEPGLNGVDGEEGQEGFYGEPGDPGKQGETGFSTQDDFENAQDDSVQDFFYNAFFPDERALNKYAAMIYNSCSGGKMYEEAKGAAFCNSCGEKTFICPHKVAINCVLELPPNCTHIKITRPWSHIITMEAKLQRKNNETPTPASAGSSVTSSEPSPINQQTLQTTSAVLEGLTNKSNNDKEQQPLAVLGDCKTQPPQATSSWWGEEEKALYVTKLRELLKTDSEYISSSEFAEAFENIAPLCNEKLQQTLVQQSLAAQGSDLIPLRSAARILFIGFYFQQ
ncbi:Collagen alpha-2(VI) chain [Acipenser ruthenus]|uniref:Collagen alpha-2(VI) chain n=1 Tax=Acipenser ruthenus TaxID=7906 RepID=A0A444ULY9_ACIRT|nr:Collagen alpha-2(VI) chain [Acipenser ruthenus]